MMTLKNILSKIKEWSEDYLIDPNTYEVITYDMNYSNRWLSEWELAENDSELLEMVQKSFAVR